MTMKSKNDIIEAIHRLDSFLIMGHVDPDGDSLGSSLALALYLLEQAGKRAYMPAPVNWPGRYGFLEKHRDGTGEMPKEKVDAVIILDCSSADRVDWGQLDPRDYEESLFIVIDHHEEGKAFGDINWIDPESAAVGEMVFDILDALDAEITTPIAESLYMAIVTDTGRFTHSNTTARSMQICAELIERGNICPSKLTGEVYYSFSEEYLRNIGIALYNSRIYMDARIVFLTLDRASVRSFSTTFDETEGIVDLAMSVKGVELASLFKEIGQNMIRVSLRSRGKIDVGALAKELGGGGHRNAAGCTLKMPLSLAREVILDKFEDLLGMNLTRSACKVADERHIVP